MLPCLALLALVPLAAEEPPGAAPPPPLVSERTVVVHEAPPARVEVVRRPPAGGAFATLAAGSSWRSDHGIVRHRDEGDLVDGGAGVWLGHRNAYAWAAGGTDPAADEGGRLLAEMGAVRTWRLAGFALGAVHGSAGYSQERQWIFDGDALIGPVHLAAGREDDATTYRLGFGIDGEWGPVALRLAVDRVIAYPEGADGRHLATGIGATAGIGVLRGVTLIVGGGVIHDAVGRDGDTWSGAIGGMVRL